MKRKRQAAHRPTTNVTDDAPTSRLKVVASYAQHPFTGSLASSLLLWTALPPLNWSYAAWIAPIFWLGLIRADRLPGRRPYWAIWIAWMLFWTLTMQGIRLAHWANYFALLAMAGYLGIYLPLFIAISRQAVHRWGVPLLLAAPITWTGLELIRGYGPLGFSMALLAHTQAEHLHLIQVSDLFGAYGVSFIVMFVSASIATMLPTKHRRLAFWPLVPAAIAIVATVLYGHFRLDQKPSSSDRPQPARIALIQGAIDTLFEYNPNGPQEMLDQYSQLTAQACSQFGELDLVVWPETMFPVTDIVCGPNEVAGTPPWEDRDSLQPGIDDFQRMIRNVTRGMNAPTNSSRPQTRPTSWMLGVATWRYGDHAPQRFNTAMIVAPDGNISGRYYKTRPVIFGEYLPFGEVFPWLYRFSPMPNGLTPGTQANDFHIGNLTISPSICFESTIPHLIRGQVAELTRRGNPPDLLINLTNDGWFWGSSVLDLHLTCSVFRAVELRLPMLVAANTGLSTWIDGNGRLRAVGPRRATATLLAKVQTDGRTSQYARWGDGPASLCALCCLLLAGAGLFEAARNRLHRTR